MKKTYKISLIVILCIIYIYVCNITLLPNSLILLQGETLDVSTVYGVSISKNVNNTSSIQTSNNINKNKLNSTGTIDVNLNLFGKIPLKDIKVNVIPKIKVVPVGKTIGMKLYTEGVLVVGLSEINGKKPYENSDICEGDQIIQINGKKIRDTNELINVVNDSKGKQLNIIYKRNEKQMETNIVPEKTNENEYKLGLWVRDSTAGVGTMTFYEPKSNKFVALGHGITDIDTSGLIKISNGKLITTQILSITKGQKGVPGEIRGIIDNGLEIGKITTNTKYGIYGNITDYSKLNDKILNEMEVALRGEINIGKAQILCQLDNSKVECYDIEIQKLFLNNNENNKSMLIKITDERLLKKTGGIIQGMSGSPIIQNGKFIGAVTHVLVNDPTSGYGVFSDILIKQLEEVK